MEKEIQASCHQSKKNDSFRMARKKNSEKININIANIPTNKNSQKVAAFLNVRKDNAKMVKGSEKEVIKENQK